MRDIPAGMLTVSDVCGRLRVSKYQVYRLIHGGVLPATKVKGYGRHQYLIKEKDLNATQRAHFAVNAHTPPEADPLLTAAEAATRLRLSVETVRRLAKAGTLPAARGRGRSSHLRFRKSAVEAYMGASGAPVQEPERPAEAPPAAAAAVVEGDLDRSTLARLERVVAAQQEVLANVLEALQVAGAALLDAGRRAGPAADDVIG